MAVREILSEYEIIYSYNINTLMRLRPKKKICLKTNKKFNGDCT